MKGLGKLVLFVGGCWVVFALNMDVSIPSGAGGRVNNLRLMADRQMHAIVGGMIALAGLLMLIFGGREGSNTAAPESDTRACPVCAETIKNSAVKCKHCGADVDPVILAHGWTVRFPCKQGPDFDRVMSALNDTNYPILEPDGAIAVIGYFQDRGEAKSVLKAIGTKHALHGEVGWVKP